MSKSYSFSRYASDSSLFTKYGIGIKYFEIDSSRSILYADPNITPMTIIYSSPINIGASNYAHRTPKSHLYYHDGTYTEILQNAVVDMLLYNITTGESGTIIPRGNTVENIFDLTEVISNDIPF